jgi:hypothetical protein
MIDRRRARAGLGQCHRGGDQDRVVLVAVVRHEGTVLEVHAVDRGQHRSRDRGRREGRRAAEQEQRPAARLGESRGGGVVLPRPQPELFEEAAGRVQAVAAKPPEQLLRPMTDEEAADGGAEG